MPVYILISALLGVGFLAGQAVEYTHLITVEGHGFGDSFGTAFFILTGLHGLHVLVGGKLRQQRGFGVGVGQGHIDDVDGQQFGLARIKAALEDLEFGQGRIG